MKGRQGPSGEEREAWREGSEGEGKIEGAGAAGPTELAEEIWGRLHLCSEGRRREGREGG